MNFRALPNKSDLKKETVDKNISTIIVYPKLNVTNLTKINLSATPNIPTIAPTPTLVNTPTKQPSFKSSQISNTSRSLLVTHNNMKVFEIPFNYLVGYNMLIILLITVLSVYIRCLRRKNKELSDTIKNNIVLPFHHTPSNSPGSNSPGRHYFPLKN